MLPAHWALPHPKCSCCLTAQPRALFPLIQCKLVAVVGLWSCGRRVCVVQAKRQIHRAFRATFAVAEGALCYVAEQAALKVAGRIGSRSKHHSMRSVSAPLL